MDIEEFARKTRQLIKKEREAEVEETKLLNENVSPKILERRGVCVLNLHISRRHMGLYGRTILVLEPEKAMPSHHLTPGDIVGLSLSQGDSTQELISSGIISKVSQSSISIAFDESQDIFDVDDSARYRIVKLANDVTYRRLQKALDQLEASQSNGRLTNVLFGISEPSPPADLSIEDFMYYNCNLDESQKEAILFALNQPEVAIIHGPPGTGKTTTVTEIIRQSVKLKLKVLVCAPSNVAVDNLVEKLSTSKAKLVRLGHPARLLPAIQKYSLDAIVSSSDETKIVEDVRKDINKSLSRLQNVRDKGERQKIREDMKHLRKELRQREEAAISTILKKADIILATLTMASDDGPLSSIAKEQFDLVVIDECSQALEAACWIGLMRARRCILAGDHNQLPPTILSSGSTKESLQLTLMERLIKMYESKVVRMLTTQYRMHADIMNWPSEKMYDNKLIASPSVASHLLKDLSGVESNDDTSIPLLLIDTAGCDLSEISLPDGVSKGNEGEANIVVAHIENLIKSGIGQENIAVIVPYNLQVEILRLQISPKYPKLEVKSVDGFQGREKEAVVISLVRSNEAGEVGFLADKRRINVAITRARRHLAIICDSETVGKDPFLHSLIEYISKVGEVRSAEQYIQGGALDVINDYPESLTNFGQMRNLSSSTSSRANGKPSKTPPNKKEKLETNFKKEKATVRNLQVEKNSEEDDKHDRKEYFRGILFDFSNDARQTTYTFPSSLSSRDRLFVHEVAEELGLLHVSRGEGQERQIEVNKVSNKLSDELKKVNITPNVCASSSTAKKDTSKSIALEISSSDDKSENIVHDDDESVDMKSCTNCGKIVPSLNWELHSLRCMERKEPDKVKLPGEKQKPNKTKQKKAKPDTGGASSATDSTEDFDAIVAAAIKDNTSCHAGRCKNSTAVLGQDCSFCRQRFCLSHHIPEAHGCGDKAKQHARMTISREGVLYSGSGVPSKKPDAVKRAHLESKLGKKLNGLAEQRKPKAKDKEKK